jgi:hypothetical protein
VLADKRSKRSPMLQGASTLAPGHPVLYFLQINTYTAPSHSWELGQIEHPRRRPRIFNTPFETGLRSVIILTACYPDRLSLHRLVVFDHLIVHTADIGGPESMHPEDRSRAAEILVRRGLVESGLALMETRGLITRAATPYGFRYQARSAQDHLFGSSEGARRLAGR